MNSATRYIMIKLNYQFRKSRVVGQSASYDVSEFCNSRHHLKCRQSRLVGQTAIYAAFEFEINVSILSAENLEQ